MVWDKPRILEALKRLHKRKQDLSYNALAKRMQSLVSAAAYHFGSYRKAVEKAGIEYTDVLRRPRWSKQRIISAIKNARRRGHDLHWAAVTTRRDELGRAAFASLQQRLFGSWDRALHAAGLDADDVSRYRRWDRNAIVFELKERYQGDEALNSGALQEEDAGLHAAAVRHFGTYDDALRSASIDPHSVRRRRRWTKDEVSAGLKKLGRVGKTVTDSSVRKNQPALYGAAVRLYGSFSKARSAAGVRGGR
jgi:hypothetical protein